jgi:pSer/pThr/pTyr-binding forkhead associated (FHA) protein
MSLKSWVLDRMHRVHRHTGRTDLPEQEPALDALPQAPDSTLSNAEHLGVYGVLIAAIRDELEHFVASHVRLHLAIAERDRFLLTSIGVRCPGGAQARALLQQFMHEFKPEQVKRFLAREVIGAVPNAAAIDLSQFAGLTDADTRDEDSEGGEYRELLAALHSTPMSSALRPYEVSVLGRWSEIEAAPPAAAPAAPGATPSTPLAGLRREFDIEDGDGRRRVVLQAVVPGRRYIVGKGEGCDIRVNGTYASRRHAEIWLERNAWWVSDAGSTNGIRVEAPAGAAERGGAATSTAVLEQPVALAEGARIVLSARADGPASDYPWVALRPSASPAARVTPIAAVAAAPKTPLTAMLPARPMASTFTITAHLASGVRTLELRPDLLPVTVGRSRHQTLMVDRRHEGVSGHHLDITGLDETGAQVVVRGDNGVLVDGVPRATGAQFRWKVGETMVLGAAPNEHPACRLTLARPEST